MDWKSCAPLSTPQSTDQLLGTGDGSKTVYPLIKTYGAGPQSYDRLIDKVVVGSLSIAVDGLSVSTGAAFTFDEENAAVVFNTSEIPSAGQQVTAGYEFDVPVRFASDQLSISLAAFNAGDVPTIPLVEVKL